MSRLTISLLGAPQIEIDHSPIDVDTRKSIALLAYLVVTGLVQSRDTLAALLWPDYDQSRARAALRRTLSVLNRAVGEKKLAITREQVGIEQEAELWCDVLDFRDSLERQRAHDHKPGETCELCLPWLEYAVGLFHGDFMAGFSLRDSAAFDDWQAYQVESLRRALSEALEKLSIGYAWKGNYPEALRYARRWSNADPLAEEAHRLLIRLYALSGQRNAALRQYQECVRILDQELGVGPLEETTQLYQDIIENRFPAEPALESIPQPQKDRPPDSEGLSEPVVQLVGREEEWEALKQAYDRFSGQGHFVVLEGEMGIGKTTLAEQLIATLIPLGSTVLQARCYEGETNLAYAPLISALRETLPKPGMLERLGKLSLHHIGEVSRLLPELRETFTRVPEPSRMEFLGAQSLFLESLRQALIAILGGGPPGVLFLDDLNWADQATLGLLAYLLRRLAGTRLFILATWRSDNQASSGQLSQLVSGAQRSGFVTRISLHRLTEVELKQLVELNLPEGRERSNDFFERFYRETEGVPFIAMAYLNAVAGEGRFLETKKWVLPASIRDILLARIESVDEAALQLLETASVIGRSFDFETVRIASGRSDVETGDGLETLLMTGLIKEYGGSEGVTGPLYDFTYEQLRNLAYERASWTRRRLLHRRVAEAFISRSRSTSDPGTLASQIAQHLHLAGEIDRSAEFHRQAGNYSRKLFANAEAVDHYQAALAAGHPEKGRLHEVLGDLFTLTGDYIAAIDHYLEAIPSSSPARKGILALKMGEIHARLGDWQEAEGQFQSALDWFGSEESSPELANLYAAWSQVATRKGEEEQAQALASQATRAAERSQDPVALERAHNIAGRLARGQGDYESARNHLQRSLEIAERLEDLPAQAAALNNLALVHGECGKRSEAIQLLEKSLDLLARLGDRHREAALHNNLADLLHAEGRTEEAMAHLKEAVRIFTEIEVGDEALKPEIWYLTEW